MIFSFATTGIVGQYFENQYEKDLLYQANKIAGAIQKGHYLEDKKKTIEFINELDEKSSEENYRIIVVDDMGVVVRDTNKTEMGKTYIVPEILQALDGKDEANLRSDEGTIYASAYIENEKGQKIGAVLLVSSFGEVEALLDDIGHTFYLMTLGVILVFLVVISVLSQVFIVPLKNMSDSIQKISEGQFYNRIDVRGKNELSNLGNAVNNMSMQLEQVESSRQEFVSNVSHELKTPLSSIKVLSESILLQEDMPTEVYREFLQDITSEVDRMTNIINDLLSLVKLDRREAGLNIEEVNLNKLLRDVMKRLYPIAEKKNIELLYEANREALIEADEMKLSLAFNNLVENGIKYTPEGGSVKVIIDGDHQNAFVTVMDTGIGISEEEQSRIFDRFYRVDKTRDRETGGTGLGLSITHATIMLHNGSVKISSSENNGTTFVVRLPIKHI